ncbi:NodT family efflux transporter outer membrane factor (OMF) lipoprotein [Paraburkholderia youngii]|uniref:efflux transporter outer membrane subunit n=1 Tax=Paraburkholderia youngii TaxID=2782701 RepID=UPI003D1E6617
MKRIQRSAALLMPLLLIGCAVGPDFEKPRIASGAGYAQDALPLQTADAPGDAGGAQRFDIGGDIPGQWWALFQSTQLNELIDRAFKASPTIAAAQAALAVARENMLAQRGAFFPSIGVDAAASRNATPTASLAPVAANGQRIYSLFTGELTVGYSLDAFGLNRRLVESGSAQADGQRFELEAAYLALSSNVALAVVNIASLREQITLQQQTINTDAEVLGILQREYATGEAPVDDVLQQQAMLATARAALPPLQKQLALQRDALAALLGGFPNDKRIDDFDLASLHLPVQLPVSLPSRLIEQRPDVLAAEAALHAASAEVGVAIANRLPQISLTAALGTSPNAVADAFTPYNQFFNVVGKIAQPIFQGGALMHRQRAAQASLKQASAQYRSTVINAFQNVADVLHSIQADASTLQAAVAAEEAATRSLSLAKDRLRVGETPYLSVLTAQKTYEAAKMTTVQLRAARLADTVALFQAAGGGWWNRSDALAATLPSD